MGTDRDRSVLRPRWAAVLAMMVLAVLCSVAMLVPLVAVEVEPRAVRLSPDSAAIQLVEDNWSRDRYTVNETPDEIVIARRMAVWDVVAGPPEWIPQVLIFETMPLSAPLGDRPVIDAVTGESVRVHAGFTPLP